MLSHYELSTWRCAVDLVRVVDQLGFWTADRGLVPFDMSAGALLLFWTILHDERTFVVDCLEGMGADMAALARDVDSLIEQKKAEGQAAGVPVLKPLLGEPFVKVWLQRAEQESRMLRHRYLGVEHVLLAIAADPDPRLAEVFSRHGLHAAGLRAAVAAALLRQPRVKLVEIRGFFQPRGAGWDIPAAGAPRRFSLAMILGMTAVYALLFGVLRLSGMLVAGFVMITVFFTGILIGQAVLFGGRFPRAASVWTGAVLFPLEIFVVDLYAMSRGSANMSVAEATWMLIFCVPAGAVLGYLVGCLGAGMFCVLDWYEKRKHRVAPPAEPASGDPFAREE